MDDALQETGAGYSLRGITPQQLVEKYGSPLYVYDERTLVERCRQMKNLSALPNFHIYYSAKANSSVALLKLIRAEGLRVDALSLGEVFLAQQAGFRNDEILFLSNNVRRADMEKIVQQGIPLFVDSLDELEMAVSQNLVKKLAIRVNTGLAAGHHEKVKTQGAVKFGIEVGLLPEAIKLAEKHGKKLSGICSHVGSFFLEDKVFHQNVETLLELALEYRNIEQVDFGGGFGIPYDRRTQNAFPVQEYGHKLHETLLSWLFKTNRTMQFSIQPGRFLVAECGFALMTVQSTKSNFGERFVGTDLGFNFFPRAVLYGSKHEILNGSRKGAEAGFNVVGNICEAGDILAKDCQLPADTARDDVLIARDAGAYCFSMSSNYNSMVRPAEILLQANGGVQLIRKVESLDSLTRYQVYN